MMPTRGLSISDTRKNAIDTTSGRTRRRAALPSVLRSPQPINKLPQMAIAAIKTQAATGMRFAQAA